MPCRVGESQSIKKCRGALPVMCRKRLWERHVEQLQRRTHIDSTKIGSREARTFGDEADQVQRRCARYPRKGVFVSIRVHHRVIGHRQQAAQRWVGSAEQSAQVVVLAEEGVKAPTHRPFMIIQRPRSHPAAQLILALDEGDSYSTLGQPGGRCQPGDAATDHHNSGLPLVPRSPKSSGSSRVPNGPAIATRHPAIPPVDQEPPTSGFRARKVCRIPRCQPRAVRTSTSLNPTRFSRSTKVWTASNRRTLLPEIAIELGTSGRE